jgi:gamma-glutamylcyclotransferase (GGCT)/AIG2-like uncharacterized protein YtfP
MYWTLVQGLMMYYFAYGSNLCTKRLGKRISSVQVVGTGVLKKHKLKFHKIGKDNTAKADAFFTDDSSDFVLGVLYKFAQSDKEILDAIEGLGNGYDVKTVMVETEYGFLEAFTYYAIRKDSSLKPYDWYVQHVLNGAREQGFPNDYIEKIQKIETISQ